MKTRQYHDMELFQDIIFLLLVTAMGLGIGSCATMPFYRVPRKLPVGGKWVGKRAYCPHCGVKLRTRDLVPVFNWLITRGKCHKCASPVNPIYFFIEFTITLFAVLGYLRFGFNDQFFLIFGMTSILVVIVAIDLQHRRVFGSTLIPLIMCGIAYRMLLVPDLFDMIFTFMITVMGLLAYKDMQEKKTTEPLKNVGYLQMIAIAAIWFHLAQFGVFLASYTVFSIVLALIYRRSVPPRTIALALAMVVAAYLPDIPILPIGTE